MCRGYRYLQVKGLKGDTAADRPGPDHFTLAVPSRILCSTCQYNKTYDDYILILAKRT